jgi:hypothetical protein
MLWYGPIKTRNWLNFYKNKNKKINTNEKRYGLNKSITKKYNDHLHIFTLPPIWNLIIIKNYIKNSYYMYMFSKTYFIKIPLLLNESLPSFDINTKTLYFYSTYTNNFTKLYYTLLKSFYRLFWKPFIYKLKFKGKGYYIYKNYRNTITPQFGYSHRLYLYAYFLHVKFLSKTTLIVFGLNNHDVSTISKSIYKWRPLNIFTLRGVRFSKQVIYKKSGKVSTYR